MTDIDALLREEMDTPIIERVTSALNAAHFENAYPHEYERPPEDVVREIHDWSGIDDFNPDDPADIDAGVRAVDKWREENPRHDDAEI